MKTIEFQLKGTRYLENLMKLKSGEGLEIVNFPDRTQLREFAIRMLDSDKIRPDYYILTINEKELTYTAIKL